MRIRVNAPSCSGCRLCRQICTIEHYHETNPRKATIRVEAHFPSPGTFKPVICVQCGKCAKACPLGAIQLFTEPDKKYVLQPELCDGCGICTQVCPMNVLHIPRGEKTPMKCDLCYKCADV